MINVFFNRLFVMLGVLQTAMCARSGKVAATAAEAMQQKAQSSLYVTYEQLLDVAKWIGNRQSEAQSTHSESSNDAALAVV